MTIKNEPFRKYNLEKVRDSFTVAVNEEERNLLEEMKILLEQPKDSTALKMLAWIGAKTLQEEKISYVLQTIYANKRKNKRLGIIQYE